MRLSSSKIFQPATTVAAPPIIMAFSANEKSFFLNDPVVGEPTASHRGSRRGRARSTTKAELGRIGLSLFIDRGFSNVTVEDIAHAAGIGRRTFFRYFASKNDVAWGDFEELLVDFGLTSMMCRAARWYLPCAMPCVSSTRSPMRSTQTTDTA